MKIMYLNVLDGVEQPERLKEIISFIKKEKPDVLALSELRNWQDNRYEKLDYFAKNAELKEKHFCYSKITESLGFFSNIPFSEKKVLTDNMTHTFLQVKLRIKTKEIILFLTHLTAGTEEPRIVEIEALLKNIDQSEKTILLGDFNSLSPLDQYDERRILLQLNEIGLAKFGTTSLRKDVHSKLLAAGLIDTVREFSDKFEYSVPTNYNNDKAHFTQLRLDYIYITPNLRPYLKSAQIIRTEETNQLSDHFPIVATFDFDQL